MKPTLTILSALLLAPSAVLHAAEPIRVLVWDEQQPQQKLVYGEKFLGETIAEGVVDANGEVFDHPGLYVTDAAALPRSPGGPPSMTIAAWANHVASQFLARYGQAPDAPGLRQ